MRQFHASRTAPLAVLTPAAGVLTAATAVLAAAVTTYTITDPGSLGYGVSDGLAIDATGQVTGYSCTGATASASGCSGPAANPSPAWPASSTRSRTATTS